MIPLPSQRHLFDIPDDVAYFNSAYNSPLLNESKKRLIEGAGFKSQPWKRTPDNFFEDANSIRKLAADIFGGNQDGFAVIPSTSYGISTAARILEPTLRPGDQILLVSEEFPSNVLPWRRTARETGAEIVTLKKPSGSNWTQVILGGITNRVKVVATSTCHWTNGAGIDLPVIGKACRNLNIPLVLDATQTLSAMSFSMDQIKPDFLVSSGYKWMLCPYGFSLMYVSEKWQISRPLEETWLAREHSEDFAGLVNYSDSYKPGARRFDVGQVCTPTILPGAISALEQIRKWRVERIEKTLLNINNRILEHLERLGFAIPKTAERCPHMFGALLPDHYQGNLVRKLAENNIYISQRGNSLRFAPHMHINEDDIKRLLDTLSKCI